MAAAEVFPLVKIGGLADASASLSRALHEMGLDVRVVLPGYRQVIKALPAARSAGDVRGIAAPGTSRILEAVLPDSHVPVYVIDLPSLFDRDGSAYQDTAGRDWPDNAQRFGAYCRAIEGICLGTAGLDWTPEAVHCNDWHTGLVPALLSLHAPRPPSVFTIHNLAYQGNFPQGAFRALRLPDALWTPGGIEFHGMMSFIKGGLAYADFLTTVSPTHAVEITGPGLGFGLDGLLRFRRGALSGILNGVDYRTWDPRKDPHIARGFWTHRLDGKESCKLALQAQAGLREDAAAIVLALIARFTYQKGVDLVLAILGDLLAEPDLQLVVLGAGDTGLKAAMHAAAHAHPGRVAAHVSHDEALAHRIVAGADMLLMPSRYEPCGLTQLYALRYGTVPVVHRTGGLADTIVDVTDRTVADQTATGFQFARAEPGQLLDTVRRAARLRRHDPGLWRRIMRTGMRRDFSWAASAARYAELYAQLLPLRQL
ncbi:MAG: glycogen synthase GlgA [Gammaproteobacteria bacterium]|nr:glycogen synthase GlgA [Gammaproteobacteria bacterium]